MSDINTRMTIVNSSSVIPEVRDDRLMELDERRMAVGRVLPSGNAAGQISLTR
jgi:hypothetical protein